MRTITALLYLTLSILFSGLLEAQEDIQRVRLDFKNPEGYVRHLLLGFVNDNSATDGVDYGYDAASPNDLTNDLNWMIEDERYIIQGVGKFHADRYYPLGMFLSNSGEISISLTDTENFEDELNVYLYDSELETYTLLNLENYNNNLEANTYLDRFYLTFSNTIFETTVSNDILDVASTTKDVIVWQSNLDKQLYIKGLSNEEDNYAITIHNIDGRLVSQEQKSIITKNTINLDVSDFTDGIYILKVDSSSFSYATKVCIAN